jgi:hypothetical protein
MKNSTWTCPLNFLRLMMTHKWQSYWSATTLAVNLMKVIYNTMVHRMSKIQMPKLYILSFNVENHRKLRVTWETDFVNGLQLTIMHIKRAYLLRS